MNIDSKQSVGVSGFLEKLDDVGIPYVSWKNNHELEIALFGESDIDLFVPFDCRAEFLLLCKQESWLEVYNPIANFPWVNHFYKPTDSLKFHHLHVYFKVVTGESWLKEYILPLDEWLITNRIRSSKFGVWILNDRAQAFLFAIRHLLKCGSLTSRYLYYRESDGYRSEWLQCRTDPDSISNNIKVAIEPFLKGTKLYKDGWNLPRISTSMRFRLSMSPFLRVRWYSLSTRRIKSFYQRAINKLFYGKKKIFPNGGLVIAVSGVDGAGKSTMLAEASDFFSRFLTVNRYHLGRPQGPFIEMFRRLLNKKRVTTVNEESSEPTFTSNGSAISIRKSISATFLSLLRLRLARKISRRANSGHLVLVDRWPTNIIGKMDGPRISINDKSSAFVKLCQRIEQWAYARIPRADVCFYFELPLTVAIERNQNRIKDEKETDEEIEARFEANRDFKPLSRKTIYFDNAGDFLMKREEFLNLLWTELIKH